MPSSSGLKDVQRDNLSSDPKPGVFVGEVVNVVDPEDWGRYQVRIPIIHGTIDDYADEELPFAWLAAPGKGTFESGMYLNFLRGSTVLVAFEGGDPARPIIVAGIDKRPTTDWVYSGSGDESKEWSPRDGITDLPLERRGNNTNNVLYKSPKGATFLVDEIGGAEVLKVIDRSGQFMEFSSPVIPGGGGNDLPRALGGGSGPIDRLAISEVTSGTMQWVNLHDDTIQMFFDGVERHIILRDGPEDNRIKLDIANDDLLIDIVRDQIENFGRDVTTDIGRNRLTTITINDTLVIGVNRSVTVGADDDLDVDGNLNVEVAGTNDLQVALTYTINSDVAVCVTAPIIKLN